MASFEWDLEKDKDKSFSQFIERIEAAAEKEIELHLKRLKDGKKHPKPGYQGPFFPYSHMYPIADPED